MKAYTIDYQAVLNSSQKSLFESQVINPLTAGRAVVIVKVLPLTDTMVSLEIYFNDGSKFSAVYKYDTASRSWVKSDIQIRSQTSSVVPEGMLVNPIDTGVLTDVAANSNTAGDTGTASTGAAGTSGGTGTVNPATPSTPTTISPSMIAPVRVTVPAISYCATRGGTTTCR